MAAPRLKHLDPWLILTTFAVVLVAGLYVSGRLQPAPGGPDTAVYLALMGLETRAALAGFASIGYPTLLSLVSGVSPSLAALPYLHVGLHILAVFCFLAGLLSVGIRGLLAAIICGSLLFSDLALGSTQFILTDGPGSSFAIMAVGLLMRVIGKRRGYAAWVGLAATTFLAYQIRPAYTFLLVLLPILGAGVARIALAPEDFRARRGEIATRLIAVVALPFLLFCSFRWIMVAQFGLVASSGFMAIGVVGQFLDEDLVAQLPDDLKPLASQALVRRQELPELRLSSPSEMENRSRIEARHVGTTLMFIDLVAPSYLELNAEQSRLLSRLVVNIIQLRPRLYALQVLKEFRVGLKVCLLNHDVSVFMLLAICLFQLTALIQHRGLGPTALGAGSDLVRSLALMFFIAFSFCLSKLTLVVLILPPVERYLAAAGVFMPTLIAIPLAAVLARALGLAESESSGAQA